MIQSWIFSIITPVFWVTWSFRNHSNMLIWHSIIKVPLLWVMKGSYFGFGSPQQQADMHARSKNTHCLIICIYFYLTCSTTPKRFVQRLIFPNPSICGEWSHFHFIMPVMPDKAAFVSAVLLCVQRYRGNRYFTAPKAASSGKEWICIFIQTNAKRPTSGRVIC